MATVKFRNLQISRILNTDAKRIFPIFVEVMCVEYLWTIHSWENNYEVSRSSYLYGVNQKFFLANAFIFF